MRERLSVPLKGASEWTAALEAFLMSRKVKGVSEETVAWYAKRLKVFVVFAQKRGETPLTVSTKTILEYLRQRLDDVAPPTVNGDLRTLRAFFRFLKREGVRSDDPTAQVERVKEPQGMPRTLTDEQVAALVQAVAKAPPTFVNLRDLALICLLLDTGLRVSEACQLRCRDVDLAHGFVRVVGKGKKERMVPFGQTTKVVLYRYWLRRSAVSVAEEFFFLSAYGRRMTIRVAHTRVRHWFAVAKIMGVKASPHTLRYTFVRKWLQSGGDSVVLMRLLGHTSLAMTAYYARLFAMDLKEVHRRHSPLDALAGTISLPRERLT